MLDIKITKSTSLKEKPDENKLGFGKIFTDHMFLMDYTRGQGWHDARIVPYAPFVLDPACDGTVLPGVTRRSCIELLRDWGYDVVEGPLAIADVMKAGHDGTLEEVFGTGTAAVVSPVKELDWKGDKVFISEGKIGPLTQKLYDTMTGMQWGKIPDTKGWIVPVCKG